MLSATFLLQHQPFLQVVWYLIAFHGLICVFVWLLWQTRLFRDWPSRMPEVSLPTDNIEPLSASASSLLSPTHASLPLTDKQKKWQRLLGKHKALINPAALKTCLVVVSQTGSLTVRLVEPRRLSMTNWCTQNTNTLPLSLQTEVSLVF